MMVNSRRNARETVKRITEVKKSEPDHVKKAEPIPETTMVFEFAEEEVVIIPTPVVKKEKPIEKKEVNPFAQSVDVKKPIEKKEAKTFAKKEEPIEKKEVNAFAQSVDVKPSTFRRIKPAKKDRCESFRKKR